LSVFLASGFQIMMALQLFNWFSKRVLGTILGCWVAMEFVGLITKFSALGIYEYFPDFDLAMQNLSSLAQQQLYRSYGVLQLVVACCFIAFFLVDCKFFIFHPFQCSIVVDLESKTD
jgi:hypothetical protein